MTVGLPPSRLTRMDTWDVRKRNVTGQLLRGPQATGVAAEVVFSVRPRGLWKRRS
jgi:hypothetical protein